MKFFYFLALPAVVFSALWAFRQPAVSPAADAAALAAYYGSCPKGVILEGEAAGIETVKTIKYNIDQNAFILNQDAVYSVPVSREILYQVVMALARDNRLGVSLTSTQKVIVYGQLDPQGETVRQMVAADKLLTGAVIASDEYLQGVRLPEGVEPQTAENRRYPSICVHKFFDFVFSKRQNEYYRIQMKMANTLFPLSARPAPDGGYLADDDYSRLEPTDLANLRQLREHSEEFQKIPQVQKAVAIGETAAFIRFLRDRGNLDLVALGRHIMRK